MDDAEIDFWEQHANRGALVAAIRTHVERARRFFGATVLQQNEGDLYRTLDAWRILQSSDEVLIARMRSQPRLVKIEPEEMRRSIEEFFEFTLEDVKSLKGDAEEHLKRICG